MKSKKIRSMREFQEKHFPKSVGKECPCCCKPFRDKGVLVILPRGSK